MLLRDKVKDKRKDLSNWLKNRIKVVFKLVEIHKFNKMHSNKKLEIMLLQNLSKKRDRNKP